MEKPNWKNAEEVRLYQRDKARQMRTELRSNPSLYQEYKDRTNKARRDRYATNEEYRKVCINRVRTAYAKNPQKFIKASIKAYREKKYWLRPYKRNYNRWYFKNVYWMYRGKGGGIKANGGRDFVFETEMRNVIISNWIKRIAPKEFFTQKRINKVWFRKYEWMTGEWFGYWKNIYGWVEETEPQLPEIPPQTKARGFLSVN